MNKSRAGSYRETGECDSIIIDRSSYRRTATEREGERIAGVR